MRTHVRVFAVVLSVLASKSVQARDIDPKLNGTWTLIAVEAAGNTMDLSAIGARWVIQGDKVRYGGEPLATLAASPDSSPKILDLTFLDTKATCEGIYELDKDTLRICLNTQTEGAKERPAAFSSNGKEHWRVLTFEKDDDEAGKDIASLPGFVGLQLEFDSERERVVVNGTLDDSPAKKAGLTRGDVVLKIGDNDATKLRETVDLVRRARPGSSLSFRVRRDGKAMDLTVKVKVLPFQILAQIN